MTVPWNAHPTCRCLIHPKPVAADDAATRKFYTILTQEQELQHTLSLLLALFTTPMPDVAGPLHHHRRAA